MRKPAKYISRIVPTLALFAVALWLEWTLAARPPEDRSLADGTRLEWRECWFEVSWPRVAHCALLTLPADEGRERQVLPVVVLRHRGYSDGAGPLLFINGGPGAATGLGAADIDMWLDWREDNPWPHDLVLFDQRGVGLSRPRLECPGLLKFYRESLDKRLSAREELSRGYDLARECHASLLEAGVRLGEYSTRHGARDVLRLMRAMGGDDWNLYGTSYGTRVALEVLREHAHVKPDTAADVPGLRSVILDSVYPAERHGLLEYPRTLARSFERLFRACEADGGCVNRFGSPRANFANALRSLRERALQLEIDHWWTGERLKVKLNDARFLSAVYMGLYRWDLIEQMPAAIAAAAAGEIDQPLRNVVENYANFMVDDSFHDAVYLAVECNDRRPASYAEYRDAVAPYLGLREYLELAWEFDNCRDWRAPDAIALSQQPISAELPVLLLSGEFDPVTPPEWAARAAGHLGNAFHVVLKGTGHDAINSDMCARQVAGDFLVEPTQKPGAACLLGQATPAFRGANRAGGPE